MEAKFLIFWFIPFHKRSFYEWNHLISPLVTQILRQNVCSFDLHGSGSDLAKPGAVSAVFCDLLHGGRCWGQQEWCLQWQPQLLWVGTHQHSCSLVVCLAQVWVWRGKSPPVAECWNETPLPQRVWRYLAPSPALFLLRGDGCCPSFALYRVLKDHLSVLIVSQLQHGSPQSCWKEKSWWHYGWYLFRAAHCAWQRLPGGGCDECRATYADGFNSWECVQLYKIHGEPQILSTYMIPNTSKLVWKCQLIIFIYYYSQKAQCKYTHAHI